MTFRSKQLQLLMPLLVTMACTRSNDKAALPATPPNAASSTPAATPESAPAAPATAEAPAADVAKESTPPNGEPTPASTTAPTPTMAKEPGAPVASVPPQAAANYQYRLTGSVAAQRRSQISFRAGGFIEQIIAKSGDTMKKDQVLATLDARDFVLKLDLAKARRDQAKVALDNASKEFQREKQLQKDNASTATAFDKVQSSFEQARLSLKLAELDVATAQNAVDDTKLRAPFDAIVAKQLKDVSENVQTGTAIYEVYDVSEPEVVLDAPERLMGQVKVGDELTVQVPSANYSGKVKITRLVNVISDKTRTFQVIARMTGRNDRVVPGSYAEAIMD